MVYCAPLAILTPFKNLLSLLYPGAGHVKTGVNASRFFNKIAGHVFWSPNDADSGQAHAKTCGVLAGIPLLLLNTVVGTT